MNVYILQKERVKYAKISNLLPGLSEVVYRLPKTELTTSKPSRNKFKKEKEKKELKEWHWRLRGGMKQTKGEGWGAERGEGLQDKIER